MCPIGATCLPMVCCVSELGPTLSKSN